MKIIANALVDDESIAEDVVQEAWIKVIQMLPEFKPGITFKIWLLSIVSKCARSKKRFQVKTTDYSRLNKYYYTNTNTTNAEQSSLKIKGGNTNWCYRTTKIISSDSELQSRVRHNIMLLPSLKRAVLTLIDIHNFENHIVCDLLGISQSDSRQLLHLARKKIYYSIYK